VKLKLLVAINTVCLNYQVVQFW